MREYLIVRLQGVMQSWGGHTLEDFRSSEIFPTRSAVVGLLGACLGIERSDSKGLQSLSESFIYAARLDKTRDLKGHPITPRCITDFHTVMDARKVDGTVNKNPVITRREYLCDASYTLGLEFKAGAAYDCQAVIGALRQPKYTPVLGRRSCPLGRPMFERLVQAESIFKALEKIQPGCGSLYSETDPGDAIPATVRDLPAFGLPGRQFATRTIYILETQEATDVHQ
ncbi:type I-E CRISPR-associated protein Cas5/CasD [Gemmatimonadota bacterium]